MILKIILILLFSLIFPLNLYSGWKFEREILDKVHIVNDFRIFYTYDGKNGLSKQNKIDNNHNKIPDYIENLALRFNYSKKIYIDILKFRDPLKSKRYEGVKYIDVHVLKSDYSSTGDGTHVFNYKKFNYRDKVIAIKLSNDLSMNTLTPSHEYFHIIQNGYSMFKNRWYTEGTSKWSEGIFKKGTGRRTELPKNNLQLNQLLDKSYDAKYFWRKLAYLCDDNDGVFNPEGDYKIDLPNYPQLIQDNRIYGYNFVRRFLENLDIQDNIASKKRGFNEFYWKEKEQKNNKNNNKYILYALLNTIESGCKINNELFTFNNAVKEYLND